ncbi:MAG: CIA30 family protein [Chloroflexi bacterium]|nr:CIA30 family protein [Chloroflexota bacterium]
MRFYSLLTATALSALSLSTACSRASENRIATHATPTALMHRSQPMEKSLASFHDKAAARRWSTNSDVVMGGISTSRAQIDANGHLVFTGVVRLENNGGFATVTGAAANRAGDDLTGYESIALRVKGDGKTYQLWLYTGDRRRVHVARFTTTPNAWETIRIPFGAFRAENGFGQPVLAAPLNAPTALSYRLLISDKQAGPFQLTIDWLRAVE